MFALPFIRRRGGAGAASIPPGTYATPQDVADAVAQLVGGAPPVTLDTLAEIAARIISDGDSLAALSAAIAGKQASDPKLGAFAALALAADKLIYATGGNTLATTNLTAFARSILAATDAAGARAAIGAASQSAVDALTTVVGQKQDHSAKLDTIDASTAPTAIGLSMLSAIDAAAARNLIGAQTADADLNAIAALTTTAYGRSLLTGADAAATRTALALGTAALATLGTAGNNALQLDGDGKVPLGSLPESILGALRYQGTWNAATNTPALASPPPASTRGFFFVVNVAGATNLSGVVDWKVGDWAVSNGTSWDKVDSSDQVNSVVGLMGTISATDLRQALGLVIGNTVQAWDADLDAIAALMTTPFGRSLLTLADAAAARAAIGAQAYSQYLTNVVATLAAVPPGSPSQLPAYDPSDGSAFSLNVAEYGIGILGKGYAGEAGYVYYNSGAFGGVPAIPTNPTSRAIMARVPAAAGEIVYATNIIGAIGGITTNSFTRSVMTLAAPAANRVLASDGAAAISLPTGAAGRAFMALNTGSAGDIVYFSNTTGGVALLTTGSGGQQLMQATNIQSARTLLGFGQITFFTVTNTAVSTATPTEILFTGSATETNWTAPSSGPGLGLTANRIAWANGSYRDLKASAIIVTDGPAEFELEFRSTNAAGGIYVPTGSSAAISQVPCSVPVKCSRAGRWIVQGPEGFQINDITNQQQLRIFVTKLDAGSVNITAASVRIEQVA